MAEVINRWRHRERPEHRPAGEHFDRERRFSEEEVCDLLEQAAALGFSLEKGSELEQLTLCEIGRLVNTLQ